MKLVGIMATALFVASAVASTGCPNEARNDSIRAANEGNKALGQKQYETAIPALKKAVEKWSDNHTAWYSLGYAYGGKSDWTNAVDALAHAVQIMPEQAMYQLLYGNYLYEKARQGARDEQARRENKKPEEVTPDLTSVNFEKALQHLKEAVKLNNELWRTRRWIRPGNP